MLEALFVFLMIVVLAPLCIYLIVLSLARNKSYVEDVIVLVTTSIFVTLMSGVYIHRAEPPNYLVLIMAICVVISFVGGYTKISKKHRRGRWFN